MTSERPRIALPLGDPAGIGPEIVLKALARPELRDVCRPVVVGAPGVLRQHADACGLAAEIGEADIGMDGLDPVPLVTVGTFGAGPLPFGNVDADAGAACIAYAALAVEMAVAGDVDAVVAAPHTEESVNRAGFDFDGYPRFVAEQTGTDPDGVFLMLLSSVFRIVNATLHLSLRDALDQLDEARIGRAIQAAADAMAKMGMTAPKIGVCGLNPHAGENGLFGTEDDTIVRPAVEAARAQGLDITGPVGADALLAERAHDVYIALYHDQGHIPIKVTTPHASSAITIGTPILFGSVAHGSAHDIAGRGEASDAALAGAVERLAGQFTGKAV